MSGLKKATEKNLMVFSGRAHTELADEVAEILGQQLVPTQAYEFANGEIYVRYRENIRGSDVYVSQTHGKPVNDTNFEQLELIEGEGRFREILQDLGLKAREPIRQGHEEGFRLRPWLHRSESAFQGSA